MKQASKFRTCAAAALLSLGLAASTSAAEIKTYLLLGQSFILGHGYSNELAGLSVINYAGISLDPVPLAAPQTDVQHLNSGGPFNDPEANTETSFTDLEPRFGRDPWLFGPEIGFGRVMADHHGEPIALIKRSIGGTSLAGNWKPNSGNAWLGLVDAINNADADAAANGDTLKIMGAIWVQSNGDANSKKDSQAYEQNLRAFIQELRTLVGEPDLPFVFQEHNGGGRYANNIYAAQYAVAGITGSNPEPNVAMIPWPAAGFPSNPDIGHWNAEGCLMFGMESAVWMQSMIGPVVPVPTVSITSPADGSLFSSGASVVFSGNAADDIDGDLSGSIFWYIDQDTVPFYIGATTPAQPFADGTYLITATVENSSAQQASDAITITVGTPPVNYVYTDGPVGYATSPTGGKPANRHKHLDVTLQVVDNNGAGVGGVDIDIDLELNGGYETSLSGTTDGSGSVTVTYSNAPSGFYTTTVTSSTVNGYTWDGVQPSDEGFQK